MKTNASFEILTLKRSQEVTYKTTEENSSFASCIVNNELTEAEKVELNQNLKFEDLVFHDTISGEKSRTGFKNGHYCEVWRSHRSFKNRESDLWRIAFYNEDIEAYEDMRLENKRMLTTEQISKLMWDIQEMSLFILS